MDPLGLRNSTNFRTKGGGSVLATTRRHKESNQPASKVTKFVTIVVLALTLHRKCIENT